MMSPAKKKASKPRGRDVESAADSNGASEPAPDKEETTVAAPEGAEWSHSVISIKGKPVRNLPILRWTSLPAAIATYGEANVLGMLDGTTLRQALRGTIERMLRDKNETHTVDALCEAQLKYRPGQRENSRSAAKRDVDQFVAEGGDPSVLRRLIEKVKAGEITV